MKYFIAGLLIAIFLCSAGIFCFSQDLTYSVIVKTEAEEEPQMEMINKALVTAMPEKEADIKKILDELEKIVDKTMEEGKNVTLYPQYIFDIVTKALGKGINPKDVGKLLREYQETIIEGESATKIRGLIIEGIEKGLSVSKIIEQFESKEEEEKEEED